MHLAGLSGRYARLYEVILSLSSGKNLYNNEHVAIKLVSELLTVSAHVF